MVIATGPALITLSGSQLSPIFPFLDCSVTHGAVLNLMALGIVCGAKGELRWLPEKIHKAAASRSQWGETQVLQETAYAA